MLSNSLIAVGEAQTFLFVPGSRPDMFDKASRSVADCIILDLEDGVAPGDKEAARSSVLSYLAGSDRPGLVVRINDPASDHGLADLESIGSGPTSGLAAVMVPKAELSRDWQWISSTASSPVIALVETARGLAEAQAIASLPDVARLALGSLDLAADLGVSPDNAAVMSHVRAQLLIASIAQGLPAPIDGPSREMVDLRAMRDEARDARNAGFTAKLCIHPRQVDAAREGLAPDAADVAWAQAVCSAAERSGAVFSLEGTMVDAPVIKRAQVILARSSRA